MVLSDNDRNLYVACGLVSVGNVVMNESVIDEIMSIGGMYYHYDALKKQWLLLENPSTKADIPLERLRLMVAGVNETVVFNDAYNANRVNSAMPLRMLSVVAGATPTATDSIDDVFMANVARIKEALADKKAVNLYNPEKTLMGK